MTHVVSENCIKCKLHRLCGRVPRGLLPRRPEHARHRPDECIDCAVCIPECPANAIFAEEDLPADQIAFIKINADLAFADGWKSITKRKPALPDADEWNGKPGKIADLIKYPCWRCRAAAPPGLPQRGNGAAV